MKFLRGLPPVDGANRKNLPEQPCTWPHGHRTSLPVLRFVSMAVMRSDDIPKVILHASDEWEQSKLDVESWLFRCQ
jgi:hypothetical protein